MSGATESLQVPDGGWGWMVALGSLLVSALLFGQVSCFGILFSRYLLAEGASSVTTAWIFNIHMMTYCTSVVFSPSLTAEFGWRRISFFSISLCLASLIISAFTPSPEFLFFSFALLTGVGAGLGISTSYLIVPLYFDKHRGKATAIQMSGSGLSQMAVAPLLRYLLDEYGVTGASIIYAAVVMNAFAGAALFHPLKWHMKPQSAQLGENTEALSLQEKGEGTPAVLTSMAGPNEDHDLLPMDSDARQEQQYQSCSALSQSSCHSHVSGELPFAVTIGSDASSPPQPPPRDQSPGTVALLWMTLVRVVRNIKQDIMILKHFRALIIAFSFTLIFVTYFNFMLLIPFAMLAANFSLEDAAWCISVVGFVNIVMRAVVSILVDFAWFNQRYCIIFGSICSLISILVFSFSSQLTVLLVAMAIYGLGLSCTMSFQLLVMIRFMGLENFRATFGACAFVIAFGFPIFGPIIGLIRDATGNYAICLWTMAALQLITIFLWLMMPAAVAADSRRFPKPGLT